MNEKHVLKIVLNVDPPFSEPELIGKKGIGHLLFEAIGKAMGSVGGHDDGVGFARDAATEVKASFDQDTNDTLVFAVWIQRHGQR